MQTDVTVGMKLSRRGREDELAKRGILLRNFITMGSCCSVIARKPAWL